MEKIIEVWADTGMVIERDLTTEEIAQREADAVAFAKQKALDDAAAEAKSEAKAALLERLGITEAEAKLLLP